MERHKALLIRSAALLCLPILLAALVAPSSLVARDRPVMPTEAAVAIAPDSLSKSSYFATQAGRTWNVQSEPGWYLADVDFVDLYHGWALGEGGLILHTDDGGSSWGLQDSGSYVLLNAVSFVDQQHGWAVGGDRGQILHTEDGGATWDIQHQIPRDSHFINMLLYDVDFVDASTGWAVGGSAAYGAIVLHTADGGRTWVNQVEGIAPWLQRVSFMSTDVGWAVSHWGTPMVLQTEDGGRTWTRHDLQPSVAANDMFFVDGNSGWIVGNNGLILHTGDGGEAWLPQESHTDNHLWRVFFVDALRGWATGYAGMVLATSNGGQTWIEETSVSPYSVSAMDFVDSLNGWTVGSAATILHTTDGGVSWQRQKGGLTSETLTGVSFADSLNGWAVGGQAVFHTDDGNSWVQQYSGYASPSPGPTPTPAGASYVAQSAGNIYLRDVNFVDGQTGWAVGNAVIHTSDGGVTWTVQEASNSYSFTAVDFVDAQNGWAVDRYGAILHTSSGGTTWSQQAQLPLARIMDLQFVNETDGWAVGDGESGAVFHTSDGGVTWLPQDTSGDDRLTGVFFLNENEGWAVGERLNAAPYPTAPRISLVLHTANGGDTWEANVIDHAYGLSKVGFADANTGWIAGGTLLYTSDGGKTWLPQDNGANSSYSLRVALSDVAVVDPDNTWAVGDRGTIIKYSGTPEPGRVEGRVKLQGRGQFGGITVDLNGRQTQTDEQGLFSFDGLPQGAYIVSVAAPSGHLQAEEREVIVGAGLVTVLPTLAILAGDTNDDSMINLEDLAVVAGSFGSDASLCPEADINGDGLVNIMDLSIAGLNFGKAESAWPGRQTIKERYP